MLSLNIHRNRIGIAIASHPSFGTTCHELEPLRFADDHITIDKACVERFQSIIEEYKVCGIVVSWPLQSDTGRMGAACGRVLYTLEALIEMSSDSPDNRMMMSPNRPLCLWDSGHIVPKQRANPKKQVDSFGRCAQYGLPSTKEEYRASVEQYHEDELTVVQQVWNDFCKEHWPDLFPATASANTTSESDDVSTSSIATATATATKTAKTLISTKKSESLSTSYGTFPEDATAC